ncbi:hypothetical protein PC128_g17874 [Phytophthora cactorum]|nr:hypothetical protein PC128_g17874 [Phytophthora cactorum]
MMARGTGKDSQRIIAGRSKMLQNTEVRRVVLVRSPDLIAKWHRRGHTRQV